MELLRGDGRWKRDKRHVHMTGNSETACEHHASLVVAMASFLKHECVSGFGAVRNGVIGWCGRTVVISNICSNPQGSAVIRVFRSCCPLYKLWCCSSSTSLSSIAVCSFAQVAPEASFTFVRWSALWNLFGVELWAFGTIRQEWRFGTTAGTVFVCVWLWAKMTTIEHAEEAKFFLQRVI